jgi:hypothetical protein
MSVFLVINHRRDDLSVPDPEVESDDSPDADTRR